MGGRSWVAAERYRIQRPFPYRPAEPGVKRERESARGKARNSLLTTRFAHQSRRAPTRAWTRRQLRSKSCGCAPPTPGPTSSLVSLIICA